MQTGTISTTETIAAIFSDERQARMAMRELEAQGFKHTWIGTVRAGEALKDIPVVESADGGGMFETIGRFFGGEGDRSLHAVLTSHGITSERARRLVRDIAPGNAVLTVEVEEIGGRALETLEAHGGNVGRESSRDIEDATEVHERSSGFV
jgi:hypothetical protein